MVLTWLLAAALLAPLQAAPSESMRVWRAVVPRPVSFADDVAFLREHADVLVLQAEGAGPVAISPHLSGRVMTSAFVEDEPGFGLVNRAAILAGPVEHGFANYGGEDRLWLAPEGGPSALFFARGEPQTEETWSVPAWMDGAPRALAASDLHSARFARASLNISRGSTTVVLDVERRLEALSRTETAALLGVELPPDVRLVAFRSVNQLSWPGAVERLPLQAGLWVLGQFKPTDQTTVFFPFRGDSAGPDAWPRDVATLAIKRDYFGVVPDERLCFDLPGGPKGTGVARFRADGRERGKIGVSLAAATGWIGAFDEERGVLSLVNHTLPPPGAMVPDCDWQIQNVPWEPGDVAASYNHGGEPRFFELESLSAALGKPNEARVEHVHSTIHLGGERAALAALARAVLHAEL